METLSKDELRSLLRMGGKPSVSLYMPTDPKEFYNQKDPILFKNLLKEAQNRLAADGLKPHDIQRLLGPARPLMDDSMFWTHCGRGLAVFLAADFGVYYRLPAEFPELAMVNDRFYLKPLLKLFATDNRFYLLAVSQRETRLWLATPYGLGRVQVRGLPAGVPDSALFEKEQSLQMHSTSTRGLGGAALIHGHGEGKDDHKTRVLEYLRQVNKAIRPVLAGEKTPLVFCGVDYLFPLYRSVNNYAELLPEPLAGNPASLPAEELWTRATELAAPVFHRRRQEAVDHFRRVKPLGRAPLTLEDLLPNAFSGRIAILFIPAGVQNWGTYNPATRIITSLPEGTPGGEDLHDLLARQTLLHGGSVFEFPAEEMPDGARIAGVLRY